MTKASADVDGGANQIGVPGRHRPEPGADRSALKNTHGFEPSCGDIDMRIARDGTWFYLGTPIGRPALVKLFASILRRDEAGDYWLVTPVERARILVEDAPFTAVELSIEGAGHTQSLRFRTNLDEHVIADIDHPIRVRHDGASGEPRPYILVRPGLDALIARSVYYQLVEAGVEERQSGEKVFGVWSQSRFFALGKLEGDS